MIPESCITEDDSHVNEMFPAIQNSIGGTAPEAISVPRKPVCEVSEHCHSHQINTKLNAVHQTHRHIHQQIRTYFLLVLPIYYTTLLKVIMATGTKFYCPNARADGD